MTEHMRGGQELPREKRYELFPVLEGDELALVPDEIRRQAEREGWSDEILKQVAIREFEKETSAPESEVRANPLIAAAADTYLNMLKARRALRERLAALEASAASESRTGITGLATLFEVPGIDATDEKRVLVEAIAAITADFEKLRNAVRAVHKGDIKKIREEDLVEIQSKVLSPSEVLFSLARRGDARRKYAVWAREEAELDDSRARINVFGDIVRLRQRAEDLAEATAAELARLAAEDREKLAIGITPEQAIAQISVLRDELERVVDRLIDSGIGKPAEMPDDAFRATLREHLLKTELAQDADALRTQLEDKEQDSRDRERAREAILRDSRNSDLAEFIQDREIEELLRLYHVERKRYLPVGDIAEFIDGLDRVVTSPRGPILRALLYGPPGTGKTEGLREVAVRHSQRARVISLHETSNFETLVGMHQIPLPKAETLADAERFWQQIENADGPKLVELVPTAILKEFAGENDLTRALDFRKWFDAKLKAARAASALGAISPDDPRLRRAQQEALAAWLDQPLAQGLMDGDLVILDEADRAGNALEGLQDLLTRRPGDTYQPPGRTKAFRIHPKARVVMTANWGDIQTEATGGAGRISAPIASRVLEKRKVDYASSETELKLFEIMTSTPDGQSLLKESEHRAARALVEKVFPRLRDFYLKPGELQLITPISIRTLENIARRLIDETTRTRVRDAKGNLMHFVEAAWAEIFSGPFREDQIETIRRELAQICADQGLFAELSDDYGELRYLKVAKLTGLEPAVVETFIGAPPHFAGVPHKLPKDFTFGTHLEHEPYGKNEALHEKLTYRSTLSVLAEEDREWRRAIEEKGGNPEVQRALEKLIMAWDRKAKEIEAEVPDDTEKRITAHTDFLEGELAHIDVTVGDVKVLLERFPDIERQTNIIDLLAAGLLVSLALNRAIERLTPDERARLEVTLDLTKTPKIDFLGYKLKAGKLNLVGEAGDYLGRELDGGIIHAGIAGAKAGWGMKRGKLDVTTVGDRACQGMEGGNAFFAKVGDRLGIDAAGGEIQADIAGKQAGQRSKARLKIKIAGQYLGEELEVGGEIHVDSFQNLGASIKGTIRHQGKVIVDRGRRV